MCPIARIDDGTIDLFGEQMDRARLRMTHDDNVRPHGIQRYRGIDQRLAFFDARGRNRHVHDVGAKPLACQFERGLGAGGGLKKKINEVRPRSVIRFFSTCRETSTASSARSSKA